MGFKYAQSAFSANNLLIGIILGCALMANGQAPVKTNLKKILVVDKANSANSHFESRRDLNAALKELGLAKGFEVAIIAQNDPASKVISEFSTAKLATYQVVLFSNNDGIHTHLDATSKANLEAYVKNGGGLIPIHAASALIENWPWLTNVLVESFFGPHGDNMPTANMSHDVEGIKDGTETKGIFKGLTAPLAFLDEYYSFRASPRGKPNVTILLTIAENSFSQPVKGPMGSDHPVVWAKTEGKGRVVHFSVGHSWSTNNVYNAKGAYLKNLLYGNLRYAAGDFVGCTDNTFQEYNPDATKSDPAACLKKLTTSVFHLGGQGSQSMIFREMGKQLVQVELRGTGAHSVTILDVSGKVIQARSGIGPASYSLTIPSMSGIYNVVAKSGKEATLRRVTVL
jgi:type 1 glutamine amidotransferase